MPRATQAIIGLNVVVFLIQASMGDAPMVLFALWLLFCTGSGGTKLERINPCANKSAIQAASLTSVLRPGTLRMCCALASTSSK
jgi:hypothetical protein